MTNHVSCEKAISALRAMINGMNEPGPEIISHWKDCPQCRNIMRKVMQDLEILVTSTDVPVSAEVTEAMLQKSENEIHHKQKRRLLLLSIVALVLLLVPIVLRHTGIIPDGWILAIVVGTTILTLSALLLAVARLPRKWELYRRLGKGRELGGVCIGLAERTQTSAVIWRFVFFVLAITGGYGITLYLLLFLAMPVHPDDRQYLLRFRLARWWRNKRGMDAAA
jgi:phage shock protein PspC (stress-responsive transcriptional regulator)